MVENAPTILYLRLLFYALHHIWQSGLLHLIVELLWLRHILFVRCWSVAVTAVSEAALQLRAAPPTADRQCLAALDFSAIYMGYLTVTGEYNMHFLFKLIAITF